MMQKQAHPLLIAAFVLLSFPLKAQHLEDVVVSGFDETSQPGAGRLAWTLGELMVEWYGQSATLDQGFLRGALMMISTKTEPSVRPVVVFPNPVESSLHIQAEEVADYRVEVLNGQGQIMAVHRFLDKSSDVDCSALPAAHYLLRIFSKEKLLQSVLVQKVR